MLPTHQRLTVFQGNVVVALVVDIDLHIHHPAQFFHHLVAGVVQRGGVIAIGFSLSDLLVIAGDAAGERIDLRHHRLLLADDFRALRVDVIQRVINTQRQRPGFTDHLLAQGGIIGAGGCFVKGGEEVIEAAAQAAVIVAQYRFQLAEIPLLGAVIAVIAGGIPHLIHLILVGDAANAVDLYAVTGAVRRTAAGTDGADLRHLTGVARGHGVGGVLRRDVKLHLRG